MKQLTKDQLDAIANIPQPFGDLNAGEASYLAACVLGQPMLVMMTRALLGEKGRNALLTRLTKITDWHNEQVQEAMKDV